MRFFGTIAPYAFILVLLTACSQSAGPLTITLSPTSIEVLRGATVDVSVNVSSSAAPTTLTITGLPTGVTASFDPATIPAGATTSTLRITAAAEAGEAAADAVVTATRGAVSTDAALDVEIVSLTVAGRLVSLFGVPQAGANVRIGTSITTTATDGTFTIAGVAVPYDLVVFDGVDVDIHVFRGMTAAAPEVLAAATVFPSVAFSAMVDGNLPGPVPPGGELRVCAEGLDGRVFGCTAAIPGATSYSLQVTWYDPGSRALRLHFLMIDQSGGDVAYVAAATLDTTVTDAANVTAHLVADVIVPADTATLSATVMTAAGATVSGYFVAARLGGRSSMPINVPILSDGSATLEVPLLGAGTFDVYASASGLGDGAFAWRLGVAADADVDVYVPSPAVLTAPADATTGVTTGTTFATTSGTGMHTFIFSSAATTIAVSTMSRSITLSDLADLGVSLPPSTTFQWSVWTHGGGSTIEDSAVGWIDDFFSLVSGGGQQRPARDGSYATSDMRSFTTAP
jgi:hypothetical protein